MSELDTVDEVGGKENWDYIRLEDRVGHTDPAEQWAADAVAQLELQQRRVEQDQTLVPSRCVVRRERG
jgi:hypothetical protein